MGDGNLFRFSHSLGALPSFLAGRQHSQDLPTSKQRAQTATPLLSRTGWQGAHLGDEGSSPGLQQKARVTRARVIASFMVA